MNIKMNCAVCGSNRFNLGLEPSDDTLICCQDCGHMIGSMAAIKVKVAEEVLKERSTSNRGA